MPVVIELYPLFKDIVACQRFSVPAIWFVSVVSAIMLAW